MEFRIIEARKAILSQSRGQATGPDEILAEIYRNSPVLTEHLCSLSNDIRKSGNFSAAMETVYVASLDKKGEDPKACNNKRPISLIRSVSKILETIIRDRQVE